MSELSRTSALASRHRELGSGLEDWNDMGTAWTYHSDANDEHDAVREAAGLFDMSPLKMVFLRGADAVLASQGKERCIAAGISVDHDDALAGSEVLKLDGSEVGVINSPCWSHRLNQSLALVHLHSDATAPGPRLEVASDDFNGRATVATTPFFDPDKSRTHA